MHSLFLYLIFPNSVPLVQYNITTDDEQVFQICQFRILQDVLKTIFPQQLELLQSHVHIIPSRCFLGAANNQKSDSAIF